MKPLAAVPLAVLLPQREWEWCGDAERPVRLDWQHPTTTALLLGTFCARIKQWHPLVIHSRGLSPSLPAWPHSALSPSLPSTAIPRRRRNWNKVVLCHLPPAHLFAQGNMRPELQGHCAGKEALCLPGGSTRRKDLLSLRIQRIKRSPVFPVLNLHHEVKQNHCGEGECEATKGQKLPIPSLANPNRSFFRTFNSLQYSVMCLFWDLEHAGIHVINTAMPCSSKDFLSLLEL